MLVRTTFRPYEEIDVDEAEFLDLQRQGLLVEDTPAETTESKPAATTDQKKGA